MRPLSSTIKRLLIAGANKLFLDRSVESIDRLSTPPLANELRVHNFEKLLTLFPAVAELLVPQRASAEFATFLRAACATSSFVVTTLAGGTLAVLRHLR
jgi:hypothetical protein